MRLNFLFSKAGVNISQQKKMKKQKDRQGGYWREQLAGPEWFCIYEASVIKWQNSPQLPLGQVSISGSITYNPYLWKLAERVQRKEQL